MENNYFSYILRKNGFVKRQNFIFLFLCATFLLLSIGARGQEARMIQGTVQDASSNEFLIGVKVMIKGSSIGTVTDMDGKFSLSVSNESILIFSYVGYSTQEIRVGGQQRITVELQEDGQVLDEVVVVGFGTQRKVNVTGAIGIAGAKDIESRPVISTTQALQGVIPGLNITQSSGSLEKTPSINIRGVGTVGSSSSSSPLILIDGMEGDLNLINPQDVESISVLKDAAASSIYGSRAPFGVILVTTKSGKAGKTSINYNNNFRWGSPITKMEMVDSYTFMNYYNEASINTRPGGAAFFTDQTLQNVLDYKAGIIDGPIPIPTSGTQWTDVMRSAYADVDWYDVFFKDNNYSEEHNISASGGTQKLTFYFSANYLNQDGLLKLGGGENLDRYNIAGKVDAKLNDWIKLGYSTRFTRTDYDKPSAMNDGLYENLARQNWPNVPLYDNNGYLISATWPGRDYIMGGAHRQIKDLNYQQVTLDLEPVKDLVFTGDFNYRATSQKTKSTYLKSYNHDVNGEPLNLASTGNSVSEGTYDSDYMNANMRGRYNIVLDDVHNVALMAGMQVEEFNQKSNSVRAYGLMSEDFPFINMVTNQNGLETKYPDLSADQSSWSSAGFFSRLNYDFKGKYLFEANLRYDGSSRYRSDKRWAWFPSFSAGWNVSNESFFDPLRSVVDVFKIRASYGSLGNNNTNNWYQTYLQQTIYPSGGAWLQGGSRPTTTNTPNPVSTSLTWETITTANIGFDWGLFKNRLTGSFDYFIRNTYDMLAGSVEMPSIYGTSVPAMNLTDLRTNGWELEVSWRDRLSNDFTYSAKFMLSDAYNTITRFPSNQTNSLSNYIVGRRTGEIWGYTTIGVAQSNEQMTAHLEQLDANYTNTNGMAPSTQYRGQGALGSNWAAGDIMYADLNGDGIINNGANTLNDHGDLSVIGNNTSRFMYSFDLNAAWKGFDLRMFFQGVMKRDYWQGSSYFWGANTDAYWSTALVQHMDFYRDETSYVVQSGFMDINKGAYYPRPSFDGDSKYGRNHHTQSRYLQNAAYLRLKNLQVGYTIPQSFTKKIDVEKVRLFFSGENLWTGTKLAKMFDPETVGGGNYNQSSDWRSWNSGNAYPLSKTFSCGLSITL